MDRHHHHHQQQQQQPPSPQEEHAAQPRCWEEFLHRKTIRVLLVETDDSTRQVVTALLRHCMYQVIPAENGHQAWAYLQDMQSNIDLVLTEVFMHGGLSGIDLLGRIMNHEVCKDIPVIMMSSHDSMGTVLSCLSNGAADFLAKPIRKNELKNLWAHVWRRSHSSSGSGSGSAIQTQKCTKSKSGDDSNNNSNNRNDDASMGLNARDGSDNGSGTQSSWTKRAVEIDSPQDMSPDQSIDPPDSTCAHVSHLKSEICSNRLRGTDNKKCQKPKETNGDEFKGKELEIGAPGNLNTDDQSSPNESSVKPTDGRCEYLPQNNSNDTVMENSDEPIVRAADLIGSMAKNMDAQQAARAIDAPNCSSQVPEGKDADRENAMPYLELSLKRSRSTADDADAAIQEEQRNVVRRSDLSAFTRYNTCAVSNQGRAGFVGSCSPNGNSSEAAKTDAAQMKQGSNGSSNNNDMGSTTKSVVTKPAGGNNKVSPINGNTHTSAFHRVQPWTPATAAGKDKADETSKKNAATAAAAAKDMSGEAQSKHPCAAAHDANGGSAGGTAQSSLVNPSGPVEGHAANYGSNSGSNNNTNNGSTAATAAGAAAAVHAETGGIDKRSNMMHMKRERRVAAVNKFREKRKERNFGKKVRYQSRKRLAEQRPRVRGQFVRQPPPPAAVER
nr:pseudo-response regulator [Triticum aestivum]BAL63504.1 pseudo-response regulator [Triticum turgidum]BAL63509.1 pseudo-response regulator [Triticum carthlicum]BAL63514.1 pseudo-response regulator [Triticum turgidum subsp. turanicum]BAL63522.1 pseudo-response regulator [Triticum polonicum]BAL63523.1 pseudo-response regulator [Triticum turgidum subsp. turgidum]BAL63533.1 pseudo-response regulator [Triticum dicoccoides]BAL63561.1 pseudo-response regulator [Triticum turgidum subsp. dicoccum]